MENCAYLRKNPGYAPDMGSMWCRENRNKLIVEEQEGG